MSVTSCLVHLQGTEDNSATKIVGVSLHEDQQHLSELSKVLKAETALWLQFYNQIFSEVSQHVLLKQMLHVLQWHEVGVA